MYQTIFLDLDDTILDFTTSQQTAFKRIVEELGLTYDDELLKHYQIYNQSLWQLVEENRLTKSDLMNTRFPGFFSEYGVKIEGAEIDHLFRDYLADGADLIPGARQLLDDLRTAGRTVYAASNGIYQTQINRLTQAGIIDCFDDLFISEKLGYNKPHAGFFESAFKQIGKIHKQESLMVGDSLSSDIKGANAVDLPVCWFNPQDTFLHQSLTVNYTIRSLEELYPIIGLT